MQLQELEGRILGAVGFVFEKVGNVFTPTEWGLVAFALFSFRLLALTAQG